MNTEMILRHTLELLILIPSIFYAMLPVCHSLRFRPIIVYGAAFLSALIISVFGGIICVYFDIPSNYVLLLSLPFFGVAYCFCVDLDLTQKLFCLFNACMLSAFCTFFTRLFTAPAELGHDGEPYLVSSSLFCLLLSVILGLVFLRTFLRKLPYLLDEKYTNNIWRILSLAALGITQLIYYINPVSAEVIMTGRVRMIGLILSVLIPAMILLFYHFIWGTTVHVNEQTKLAQENKLLQAERKRYEDLSAYINQTRIMRHDFRHHLLIIHQYAGTGEIGQLKDYLNQLAEFSDTEFSHYCENREIDAIAAHFTSLAASNQAEIVWFLDLPQTLPWEVSDLCALFCNLIENAIHAVKKVAPEQRKINLTSRMLSEAMLGISIDNPYIGEIRFDKNGLPKSDQNHHGTGMSSIASIVSRYNGTLEIKSENGNFSVNILLMKAVSHTAAP